MANNNEYINDIMTSLLEYSNPNANGNSTGTSQSQVKLDSQNWDTIINEMQNEIKNDFKRQNAFESIKYKVDATSQMVQFANKAANVYVDITTTSISKNTAEFKALVDAYNNSLQDAENKRRREQQDAIDQAEKNTTVP